MSVPDSTVAAPNLQDASAATRAMFEAPDNPAPVTTPQIDATPPPVEGSTTPDAPTPVDTTPAPLAWDAIDLSVLPEAAQQVVRDGYLRHSDYTRKTQELAEQRKQFESYGDPETVKAAVDLANSLQDPANLVQLKAEIEEHLASLGQAGTIPSTAPTPEQASSGLDPATQSAINELREWKAQQEHAAQEALMVDQMQNKLQQAEDAIRADYPSYTQADIDAIYKLSPGVGFDLFQAQSQYEEFRNHFTKELVGNKANIPGVANNVRSDALYHQPEELNTMEGAKAATQALFSAAE